MNHFIHILKYKTLAFIRSDTKLTFLSFLKSFGSILIYGGFSAGSFYFSYSLIKFLMESINLGLFLLHQFISIILFIFFVSINVGNILVSYSTLYKSQETVFFFTKPVNSGTIFTIKFLDNFFYSSGTLLMVLFSLLAGYVYYFKLSVSSLIILLFSFIPYMFSAGSLGVIVLLILIKLASKIGARKVIYSITLLYLTFIIFFFDLNAPGTLIKNVMKFYPLADRNNYLQNFVPSALEYFPNNWLAQSAFWIIKNDMSRVIYFGSIQVILSVLLFSIAFILGKKWYFETWLLNITLTANYLEKRKEKRGLFSFQNRSSLNSKTEAVFKRDALLFLREPSQVIHSIVLLFLIIIFIISVRGIKFIGFGNYYLQTMIYLSIFLFNLLLISTLSLRFIFPLVSLEGNTFWKVKSSPISAVKIFFSRFLPFGIIIFLIGLCLAVFSNLRYGNEILLFGTSIIVISSITIMIMNFGMGAIFANYKEKNPIRLSSSQGASISFLLNSLYMIFVILIMLRPINQYFLFKMINKGYNLEGSVFLVLSLLLFSIVIISLFLRLAVNSINRDL